jgi:hypothetical protein
MCRLMGSILSTTFEINNEQKLRREIVFTAVILSCCFILCWKLMCCLCVRLGSGSMCCVDISSIESFFFNRARTYNVRRKKIKLIYEKVLLRHGQNRPDPPPP